MGRTPCCNAEGLKKGAWTADEDQKLIAYIQEHGEGSWRTLPQKAGLQRCGKSCRLRWANYLNPHIKRGAFSPEEEQSIIHLHATRGNKWSEIARHLQRRTDNEIKNYWNTHLKKRLVEMGIDPMTHKPIGAALSPKSQNNSVNVANIEHALDSVAQPPEPQPSTPSQSSSSKSTSVSALLLNKVDTKLSQSASHGALSELIEDSNGSNNISTVATNGVSNIPNVESPTFSFSSTKSPSRISSSSSTSRLLNKIATRLTSIREMLSTSIEAGPSDCTYDLDGFDVEIDNGFYLECSTSASTPASLSEKAVLEMSIADSASAGVIMATSTLSPSFCDFDMPNGDNWKECGITGHEGSGKYNLEGMGINDCGNIEESLMSAMNSFLQDQQFDFAVEFLDPSCGGHEANDAATKMGFDSQDALNKKVEGIVSWKS